MSVNTQVLISEPQILVLNGDYQHVVAFHYFPVKVWLIHDSCYYNRLFHLLHSGFHDFASVNFIVN